MLDESSDGAERGRVGNRWPAEDEDGFAEALQRMDEDIVGSRDQRERETADAANELLELIDRIKAPLPKENQCIGSYRLLEEVARGGMGVVFRARQIDLDRVVAIKMLQSGLWANAADRQRFRQEAEAAARLEHPGIVPVYECKEDAGLMFIAMGFVHGESLSQRIARGKIDPTLTAKWGRQIAEAVDYAHGQGIVHRDLKPGNLLIDCEERIRITDFGLARINDRANELTHTGDILGTPEYMSPEQASGGGSTVSALTDVYSIGATLYCMLRGRPPIRERSTVRTIRSVIEKEPDSLTSCVDRVPRDLATIVHKCLQKSPANRYQSAAELGEDLDRFLTGRAIHARQTGRTERLLRWGRRNPLAAVLIALLTAVSIAGPMVAVSQIALNQENIEKQKLLDQSLYFSDVSLAFRLYEEGSLQQCGELLKRHLPTKDRVDNRGFEWHYLHRIWKQGDETPIVVHEPQLESMAISNDRRFMAIGCYDGLLSVREIADWHEVFRIQAHPYRTYSVAFSSDGETLASASVDREVCLWNTTNGKLIRSLDGSRSIAWSPTGWPFAYRTQGNSIGILDHAGATPRLIESAESTWVHDLAFSQDGRRLVSVGFDSVPRIWDVASGDLLQQYDRHDVPIWSVAWSDDGKRVATGDTSGEVRVWDTDTGRLLRRTNPHRSTIEDILFSESGEHVYSCSIANIVKRFDVDSGNDTAEFRGHDAEVLCMALDDSRGRLYTASVDGTVKNWNIQANETNATLIHPAPPLGLAFSGDGRQLATACDDGRLRIWNVASGAKLQEFQAHQGTAWSIAFVKDGQSEKLISAGRDGKVCVWDPKRAKRVDEFEAKPSLDPLPIATYKNLIAFENAEHSVVVWNWRDHQLVAVEPIGKINALCFSDNGNRIVIASDRRLIVYHLDDRAIAYERSLDSRQLYTVAIGSQGLIAAGGQDRVIKLVLDDLRGKVRKLIGSNGLLAAVVFSPDGTILAAAGDDRKIRIWDNATGTPRATWSGHEGEIVDLAFSPDQKVLASAGLDHTVKLWRAQD